MVANRRFIALLLGTLFCLAAANAGGAQRTGKRSVLSKSRQAIVVTTGGWDAVPGRMQRYERAAAASEWRAVGPAIPVVVGRNGLAWGKGISPAMTGEGPVKREGDGKAPAGVFRVSRAFGYASADQTRFVRMPYTALTSSVECVDDVRSKRYNRLVDASKVRAKDWSSSEQMRRTDELYRWGFLVNHNRPGTVPGGGSCIFLHIWQNATTGTAGCTAMERPNIVEMLHWLEPKANPVLVQLPGQEYKRLRSAWGLP